MLSGSILGKAYSYWLRSRCFALCAAVASFFARAWEGSLIRRLCVRRSRLGAFYEGSAVCGLFSSLRSAVISLAGTVSRAFAPARGGSLFARAAAGSRILSFEDLFGLFLLLMFAVPHSLWNNRLMLAGAVFFFIWTELRAASGRRTPLARRGEGLCFLLFSASLIISLIPSLDRTDSLRVLCFFAAAFMLMRCAQAEAEDADGLRRLLGWIYAAVLLLSVLAVMQRLAGVQNSASQTDLMLNAGLPGRVFSSLENPNNFAEFLVIFTPLCAAFAAGTKKELPRVLLAAGLILPCAALIMTYSRSGWLSAALAVLVYTYLTNRRLLPVIIVLAIAALPFLPAGVLLRLSNLFNPADTSADYRVRIWETVVRLLSDQRRLISGIGLGPSTLARQIDLFADDYVLSGIVHSQTLYLELPLETGLLGTLSCLLMLGTAGVRSVRASVRGTDTYKKRVLAACAASLAGMALFGVFEYIWFYPRILAAFFILFGITLGALRHAEERP